MKFPYAAVADVHCHNWSQFSRIGANGVNSRLQTILDELIRAAETLKAAGGDTLIVAGDLFHVRGKIEPSVFNPTFNTFEHITAKLGIKVQIIAGNHDLEGVHSNQLGNAMQQLERLPGVTVVVETLVTDAAVLIAWIENLDELRAECAKHADPNKDLIIHAPMNGVIKGIPDLGLTPDECAAWGYARVLCGHYHNHREFVNGLVFSVGATTHQTWSDPGTRAGFLLVHEDRVEHFESEAPKFVNIDDPADINLADVNGNYVRLRLKDADEPTLKAAIKQIEDYEARSWVDHSSRRRATIRASNNGTNNVTLEASISGFVDNHLEAGSLDKARIAQMSLAVLTEARMLGDD